jgi:hypothetical protein
LIFKSFLRAATFSSYSSISWLLDGDGDTGADDSPVLGRTIL